ncbi:hypothetical protein HN512_04955 [Candidatus Peregrinibacteria bacterium]|nr:hypothetical protein [Candidatus Peregrinibacteria bacterium]MBT3599155.1 hypothetical protein [Candidatus Peregrinibacteria bacterium]MBT6730795.1 hypothetical protein [Candidatus Peregrinibacteria bacterium]MBT7008873.1 hypothetical protein [Candidatus Peregrinibacteria bacterium]MBT7344618.1 hypothetical protein [Candidatus Peregrinibacteria bacterium]
MSIKQAEDLQVSTSDQEGSSINVSDLEQVDGMSSSERLRLHLLFSYDNDVSIPSTLLVSNQSEVFSSELECVSRVNSLSSVQRARAIVQLNGLTVHLEGHI